MELRQFKEHDTAALIDLFRTTVHTVCRGDYSQAQLAAWAPSVIDPGKWAERLSASYALVAEEAGRIAGFASLLEDGCVDMFYVSAFQQGRGVGAQLMAALEAEAKRKGLTRLSSDVSLTARKFFLKSGFVIEREYEKALDGLVFRNAIMVKEL